MKKSSAGFLCAMVLAALPVRAQTKGDSSGGDFNVTPGAFDGSMKFKSSASKQPPRKVSPDPDRYNGLKQSASIDCLSAIAPYSKGQGLLFHVYEYDNSPLAVVPLDKDDAIKGIFFMASYDTYYTGVLNIAESEARYNFSWINATLRLAGKAMPDVRVENTAIIYTIYDNNTEYRNRKEDVPLAGYRLEQEEYNTAIQHRGQEALNRELIERIPQVAHYYLEHRSSGGPERSELGEKLSVCSEREYLDAEVIKIAKETYSILYAQ